MYMYCALVGLGGGGGGGGAATSVNHPLDPPLISIFVSNDDDITTYNFPAITFTAIVIQNDPHHNTHFKNLAQAKHHDSAVRKKILVDHLYSPILLYYGS